jgi:hypothetical protein
MLIVRAEPAHVKVYVAIKDKRYQKVIKLNYF